MIITTTNTIEGKTIVSYLGVVCAEVIFGANLLTDLASQVRDIVGGRNREYEREIKNARTTAIARLKEEARSLGATAVVGVAFDFQPVGSSMLMVCASGTAIRHTKTAEEKERDELEQTENHPDLFVMLEGRERGPFSVQQVRELVASGRLELNRSARRENSEGVLLISQVIK